MSKGKVIVLLSGGMDSLVTAAIAGSEAYELYTLHINYGQRTEKRELKSFNDISDHYRAAKRFIVDMKYLSQIGGSSLTDYSIPVTSYNPESTGIPVSYVPFRNANILSVAVSWAEICNAGKIFIGAVEEDSSGYPDCREVFYNAFNRVIELGTKPETFIEVVTPLIHMKKHEIVKKGLELKAPFEISWSCYKSEDIACGECDSCYLRLKGFHEAGVEDPIPYKTKPEFTLIH
ncbi:MAG: 7-cyano-7-deazaguanine synthase QueC [Ignavibacteria bacterium]|nr:7-cyano-7-deazaguanine synthase QueC [Ignavibacteria bacterium]